MPIKHNFQSGRGDNGDAGAVQPSQWNADHVLTGTLAALDAVAPTPNVVVTFDGSNAIALVPTSNFAPTFSPTFTGVPLAPTASAATNSTQIATTEFVATAIANLVASAPSTLDTLNEIATALGNDPNFSATITAALGNRLRLDASGSYSGGQQAQGRSNLGLGSAATLNAGTGANNLVQLDGSSKLPAVDGSQLTNIAPSGSVRYDIQQSLTAAQQDQAQKNLGLPLALRGYIAGLMLSAIGGTTFNITAGVASDSTYADVLELTSAWSKGNGAWSAGNTGGALDTGAYVGGSWYHVFIIKNPTTGAVDILTSASATAPTMPSGYTLFRRIGSLLAASSSSFTAFTQLGDEFLWATPAADVSVSNLGTTATLYQLTVPTGVQVIARMRGTFNNATTFTGVLINSPDETTAFANSPNGNILGFVSVANVACGFVTDTRTNTSGQIRAVASAASMSLKVATYGWIDRRGRDI